MRIYAKVEGDRLSGLTVMVVDDTEAIFINVAGTIDPAQLGNIARATGMGEMLGAFGIANGKTAPGRAASD